MGILYDVSDLKTWGFMAFVLLGLIAFNELGRAKKWSGILLFVFVPLVLTIFVWPKTAALGNEYGTGTWFTWVKTYSALAGCIGFMLIRYIPKIEHSKFAIYFPPVILAANIFEAVLRDFQVFSWGLTQGDYVANLWTISGPWNIMNGIAGIFNILLICGWAGIFVSKEKTKDMMWPDMGWVYILTYDLWNFAYTYNCISDHSAYCGMLLLLSCTIPAIFIKKGCWLQHRAQTLAFWGMFIMTVPMFADRIAPVPTTHNPTAFFIVSFLALISNVGLFAYQTYITIKTKKNPLKDELYTHSKTYKKIVCENKA